MTAVSALDIQDIDPGEVDSVMIGRLIIAGVDPSRTGGLRSSWDFEGPDAYVAYLRKTFPAIVFLVPWEADR